jgi:chromosome segregation ATPase
MATISLDKYDELKAKFLRVDRSYESLKSLSRKAISEFEDLRNRYKLLGKNYQKEKKDHEETKNKLNDIEQEHDKLRESAHWIVLYT